jgi:hypothetical protein
LSRKVFGLRTVGERPASEPVPAQTGSRNGEALAIRRARRDGREVATIRCFQDIDAFAIECEVYPISRMVIEPLRPGPYRFAELAEASAFLDEATLCLRYLGCDVA